MASFRGLKERINSIKTTQKITSAMKMVASAKLHRAQKSIGAILLYSSTLSSILKEVLLAEGDYSTPLTHQRELKRVAIIAFSSDTSLAGSFNSNVAREFRSALSEYEHLGRENIRVYTIGKKIYEAVTKSGVEVAENFEELAPKPDYERTSKLAAHLTKMYVDGELDRVIVIYHHFRSAGSQQLVRETFLPLQSSGQNQQEGMPKGNSEFTYNQRHSNKNFVKEATEYILEPTKKDILDSLLPQSLRVKLYAMLLDSNASEHAARMIAMQTATENAKDLISELTIEYNKSRQQAITNELLDIMGGSMN